MVLVTPLSKYTKICLECYIGKILYTRFQVLCLLGDWLDIINEDNDMRTIKNGDQHFERSITKHWRPYDNRKDQSFEGDAMRTEKETSQRHSDGDEPCCCRSRCGLNAGECGDLVKGLAAFQIFDLLFCSPLLVLLLIVA